MKTNKSKKKNSAKKKKSTKKKTSRNSTTKKSFTTSSTESDSSDSSDSSSDEEMQDSSDDENVDIDGASLYDSILHRVKWTRIILDEAHKIKSRTNNTGKTRKFSIYFSIYFVVGWCCLVISFSFYFLSILFLSINFFFLLLFALKTTYKT